MEQAGSARRETVAAVEVPLDDAGGAELDESLIQHARRHGVAALAQTPEVDRPPAEFPEHAQRPAAAEQVERCHDRTPGPRPAHPSPRSWCGHPRTPLAPASPWRYGFRST